MTQLALLDFADLDRPLPEVIALHYHFALAHQDVGDKRFYAIQDWIAGIAQTETVKAAADLWKYMKRRLDKAGTERVAWCTPLSYRASDGKTYKRDHATAEGLYLIAQRLSDETDKAGIVDKVLRYLARAGVALDEMRRDPSKAIDAGVAAYKLRGKDDRWIRTRLEGKVKRNQFTAAINAALSDPQPVHFALATDEVSVGLFERTTAKLKAELGLPKDASLRDYLPSLALAYLSIAEEIITQQLGAQTELTWEECEAIIVSVAALIKPQIDATAKRLRVDLATGKPLLNSTTKESE